MRYSDLLLVAAAGLAACSGSGDDLIPGGNNAVDPNTVGVGGDLTGVDPTVDTDQDGIPDVQEGTGDANGNGRPAHLDPEEQGMTGGGTNGGPAPGTGNTSGLPDSGAPNVDCLYPPDDLDVDGDGYTKGSGDCDECDENINPGAFDFPGDDRDVDCSGSDATPEEHRCDTGLALDSTDPRDAARALGLCNFIAPDEPGWGVLDAQFTLATGEPAPLEDPTMVGLPDSFGAVEVREGERLLALSSGVARALNQPGFTSNCDWFDLLPQPLEGGATPPAGFPKAPEDCNTENLFGVEPTINNQVALQVRVRVPTNANSLAFDSIFFTHEYPNFVCSQFNDFFVVLTDPALEGADEGSNIVFDSNGDPIGVNTGLLAQCNASDTPPKDVPCDQGTNLLVGTGFAANESDCGGGEDTGGAATGWLETRAPVQGGQELTLRFAVWDTNDRDVDSTALMDNFRWSVEEPKTETVPIPIQ